MPDIRAFLPFLRRNAVWIAAVAVPVALACFVLVRLIFNQYSATATVLFDPRNAKVTTTQEVLSDIGPDSIAIESLVQVAKSDGFLTALVARLGLADDSEFGGSATAVADRNAAALDKLRDRLAIRSPRRDLCRRPLGQIRRRAKESQPASPTPPPT